VVDFDAAVDALRVAGVVFLVEQMDSGVCRMTIVLDPDGNAVAITKGARNEDISEETNR
jgi:hypothetical protein